NSITFKLINETKRKSIEITPNYISFFPSLEEEDKSREPVKKTILNDFDNTLQFIFYTPPHPLYQHSGCGFYFFLFKNINCTGIVCDTGKIWELLEKNLEITSLS